MLEDLKSPLSEDANSAVVSVPSLNSGLSSDALARRRMLLKSLGKGSAVVAAALPMHTLAAGTLSITYDGKRCTFSGTMSNVHSQETVTTQCDGQKPSNYSLTDSKWPDGVNRNALCTTVCKNSKLKTFQCTTTATTTVSTNGKSSPSTNQTTSFRSKTDKTSPSTEISKDRTSSGTGKNEVTTITVTTEKTSSTKVTSTLFEVMNFYPDSAEAHWIAAWLNASGGGTNFPYTPSEVIAFYNDETTGLALPSAALEFFKNYMERK